MKTTIKISKYAHFYRDEDGHYRVDDETHRTADGNPYPYHYASDKHEAIKKYESINEKASVKDELSDNYKESKPEKKPMFRFTICVDEETKAFYSDLQVAIVTALGRKLKKNSTIYINDSEMDQTAVTIEYDPETGKKMMHFSTNYVKASSSCYSIDLS